MIVTDNLFGDILTDLGAAIAGGIGTAASGNLNPTRTARRMFEPVHGSAPDIAGTGRANPVAAVLSASMLLDYLGEGEAAAAIEGAVAERSLPGAGRDTRPQALEDRSRRPGRRAAVAQEAEARCRSHKTDKIWMDGELVDWDDAKIHVLTHTLHYGCGVFEGIRAYATTQARPCSG